ncbi:hypothetical protein H6775_02510 [Candidatus Nomurabacteria bacterium]|nr:hypothetical protein [Candidatus Nomurabacteria bacterium]
MDIALRLIQFNENHPLKPDGKVRALVFISTGGGMDLSVEEVKKMADEIKFAFPDCHIDEESMHVGMTTPNFSGPNEPDPFFCYRGVYTYITINRDRRPEGWTVSVKGRNSPYERLEI